MAETLNIPNKVINSDWKDDIDVDYAIYGGNEKEEMKFISKKDLGKKVMNITKIKNEKISTPLFGFRKRNKRIGTVAMFRPGDKLAA